MNILTSGIKDLITFTLVEETEIPGPNHRRTLPTSYLTLSCETPQQLTIFLGIEICFKLKNEPNVPQF